MGICTSCESTSPISTAKLILHDGRLQEYSYPVKVSNILSNFPSSFICNSDDMEFNDVVSAMKGDDELQLGQIYFVLPLDQLKRPLKAAEMAALAVSASSALSKSNHRYHVKPCQSAAVDGGFRTQKAGSQNFPAMLKSIPE